MAWTTPATFTAGSVLTAAQLNTNVRDNTNALYSSIQRIAYSAATTTDYSATNALVSGAANFFSTGLTFTADGTSSYRVEFYSPQIVSPTTAAAVTTVVLVDGSGNQIAVLGVTGSGNGTQAAKSPLHAVYYYTPAAGSRTLNIRGIVTAASNGGTISAATASGYYTYLAIFGPPMA